MIAGIIGLILSAAGEALKAYEDRKAEHEKILGDLEAALRDAADKIATLKADHAARTAATQAALKGDSTLTKSGGVLPGTPTE